MQQDKDCVLRDLTLILQGTFPGITLPVPFFSFYLVTEKTPELVQCGSPEELP